MCQFGTQTPTAPTLPSALLVELKQLHKQHVRSQYTNGPAGEANHHLHLPHPRHCGPCWRVKQQSVDKMIKCGYVLCDAVMQFK